MTDIVRCINLDWLEVHVLEPISEPHNANYYRDKGWWVKEREFGTRVYREMFTLFDEHDIPFIEVRRNPASQGLNGIHASNESHLRLVNRTCYHDDAAKLMAEFINTYNYVFQRISRVDVCLDFETFDYGDKPQDFLGRYLRRKYSKINQGNIHSHGMDSWTGQVWNSVSWGSPSSDIGTKFYNKTLELYDQHTREYKKPYIRQAWALAGLVDDWHTLTKKDAHGYVYVPQIWRVEFSIRSSVKRWYKIELNGNAKEYQSIRNTLDMYDSRAKLLTIFASLASHYFHFKHYEDGVRKDRCRDKKLFDFKDQQVSYKVGKTELLAPERKQNPFSSLLSKLKFYRESHFDQETRLACDVIIKALEDESYCWDLNNPFSREELEALRTAIRFRTSGDHRDPAIIMREVKALLKINDKTLYF